MLAHSIFQPALSAYSYGAENPIKNKDADGLTSEEEGQCDSNKQAAQWKIEFNFDTDSYGACSRAKGRAAAYCNAPPPFDVSGALCKCFSAAAQKLCHDIPVCMRL